MSIEPLNTLAHFRDHTALVYWFDQKDLRFDTHRMVIWGPLTLPAADEIFNFVANSQFVAMN